MEFLLVKHIQSLNSKFFIKCGLRGYAIYVFELIG